MNSTSNAENSHLIILFIHFFHAYPIYFSSSMFKYFTFVFAYPILSDIDVSAYEFLFLVVFPILQNFFDVCPDKSFFSEYISFDCILHHKESYLNISNKFHVILICQNFMGISNYYSFPFCYCLEEQFISFIISKLFNTF